MKIGTAGQYGTIPTSFVEAKAVSMTVATKKRRARPFPRTRQRQRSPFRSASRPKDVAPDRRARPSRPTRPVTTLTFDVLTVTTTVTLTLSRAWKHTWPTIAKVSLATAKF